MSRYWNQLIPNFVPTFARRKYIPSNCLFKWKESSMAFQRQRGFQYLYFSISTTHSQHLIFHKIMHLHYTGQKAKNSLQRNNFCKEKNTKKAKRNIVYKSPNFHLFWMITNILKIPHEKFDFWEILLLIAKISSKKLFWERYGKIFLLNLQFKIANISVLITYKSFRLFKFSLLLCKKFKKKYLLAWKE